MAMSARWRRGLRIEEGIGGLTAVVRMIGDTILQIELYDLGCVNACVLMDKLKRMLGSINTTLGLSAEDYIGLVWLGSPLRSF